MLSAVQDVRIIERAFQIARECGSVDDVRKRLDGEGYINVQAHLSGKLIRDQLYERLDPALKKPHGRQRHAGGENPTLPPALS